MNIYICIYIGCAVQWRSCRWSWSAGGSIGSSVGEHQVRITDLSWSTILLRADTQSRRAFWMESGVVAIFFWEGDDLRAFFPSRYVPWPELKYFSRTIWSDCVIKVAGTAAFSPSAASLKHTVLIRVWIVTSKQTDQQVGHAFESLPTKP